MDLKEELKANLLLETLKNLSSSQEYQAARDSIERFVSAQITTFSSHSSTEIRLQALLVLLQSLKPQQTTLCNLSRILQLLPEHPEPALDSLCLLALHPASKMSIVTALQRCVWEVSEAMLFPVTTLLRNLALSSLDKALIADPSQYSESETEQLRELMRLSGAATPSTESEEQSGVAKRLLAAAPVLPKVLSAVTKSRKVLSPALLRIYMELIFGLAEIKETRSLLVSNGALELLLKSSATRLAGHAISRLLLSITPNLLPQAVVHDCVKLIQGALSTSTHQLTDLECALALVNLSGYHADYRNQMIAIGTHRSALDLIGSEHPLISKTGLELLSNLSASDLLHEQLSKQQGLDLIQVLIALLDSPDQYTAYLAVSGLANLAPLPQLSILLTPAVKATLQTLSSQHSADEWSPRLAAITSLI